MENNSLAEDVQPVFYDDRGFLNDFGRASFEPLKEEVRLRLAMAKDENDLRFIGGLICQLVGDLVADEVKRI